MMQSLQKTIFLIFLLFFSKIHSCFWSNPTISSAEAKINRDITKKDGTVVMVVTNNCGHGNTDARFTIVQQSKIPDLSKIFDTTTITAYMNAGQKAIQNHYGKIIAGTICSVYCWILYQIRQTNILIKQQKTWCNWKAIIPLSQLQSYAQQELFMQLKADIYKKYVHSTYAHTNNHYVALFIQDIKSELATFDAYIDWYHFTQNVFISRFFNFSFDPAAIEEKKARLYFLLDILTTNQTEKM